jgi:hypothetical protein
MKRSYSLYDQTLDVTADYLGPAAKRFIDRQITAHLYKNPEDLTANDLATLAVWMEAVIALLTDDKKVVARYIHELKTLSNGSKQGHI